MADSSQVNISYAKETTFGVTPNSDFKTLRHIGGGGFGQTTETVRSNEIRGDAQRAGTFRSNIATSPNLDIEFSPETFNDFIEACMRSTWSTAVDITATDISAVNADSRFESTSTDFTAENISVGQWVRVDGFSTAASNGWFKVTAITATQLTVSPAPADDAGGESITIKGSYIRNGQTESSFSLQKQHKDLTNKFLLLTGARCGSFSINIQPGQIVTGSFNFEGLKAENKTSASGTGTIIAAGTDEVLNAVDNVERIMIGGTETTSLLTQLSFNVNMNPRRQDAISVFGASGIGMGSADVTGSIQMYLDDNSWSELENYLDFVKQGFSFAFNINGQGYVFEFPKMAYTNEPGNLNGNDTDETLAFDFAAEPGTIGSETKTIQITKA